MLLLALALAGLADGARAQTGNQRVGAPIQLRPGAAVPTPDRPASRGDEAPLAPAGTSPRPADGGGLRIAPGITVESTAPSQRPRGQPRLRGGRGDVEIGVLKPPDPSASGTLDRRSGSFGPAMWEGSRLATVKLLLPRLPMTTASPVMQSLARRLLLTPARLPEPDDGRPSLLALRVERLAAGGRLDEVRELLDDASAMLEEPALVAARVDSLWLAGDDTGACALAQDLVTRLEARLWMKSAAFCHALAKEPASVGLYEQLLLESDEPDPAFQAMLGALMGRGGTPLKSLPAPAALHLAMLRALGWPLPEDALREASPLVLRGLAEAETLAPERRLAAAERAAALGALGLDTLRRRYGEIAFSPQVMQAAEGVSGTAPGARSNALAFQAARLSGRPEERARLLQQALAQARADGRHALMAGVMAEIVASIPPEPALAWFAGSAGRALLAAGNLEGALAWWHMVNGADSPDAQTALSALWPPLLIAAEPARVPFDEPRFDDWWRTASRAPVEARQQGAVLLVGLLAALGREVPPPVWEKVYAASPAGAAAAPSQAYLQALGAAATAGRLGETVLLSLLNLGPGGPAAAHPLVLGEAVAALRRVGLEAEARQVALEAVLAREF